VNEQLQHQLDTLPDTPGIYIYKDAKGNVLYVGKAKVLKHRVRSYFRPSANLEPAKVQMVRQVASLETISTDTETEALVLEASLIRQHQPPYNVVLRDDKYYLFIKITHENPPRIFPVRRMKKDGSRYFGPYSSARSVRATLRLLQRIFPFHGEKESPREIIFPHPLFSSDEKSVRRAGGPDMSETNIDHIIRFLKGDRQEILERLKIGMKEAAATQAFERAQIFRDQLQAIERLEGSQKVYLARPESFDIVSIAQASGRSAANVFAVRRGKLLQKNTFLLHHRSTALLADIVRQFILQYYQDAQDIPKDILLPVELPDAGQLAAWISADNPPRFAMPERGVKYQLLHMGETNAKLLLAQEATAAQKKERAGGASDQLAAALGLPTPLKRVEIYDISNIQGTLATASMVVFEDGQANPKQYKKFKISIAGEPNDFAMLQETLRRRFAARNADWPQPSLVIIDGGKGQLSASKKVLDELGVTIPIISLAKREEEIFLPGQSQSLRLPYDSEAMYLIQRMRDEAHRFTITYHRLLRSKQQQRSLLDEVPGIGPKTKQRLLRTFGSLKNIRAASDEALAEVLGKNKVKILRDYL
jgi:excinuclease ABC subunit C